MIIYSKLKFNNKPNFQGTGLLNNLINSLPFELHLPGYQYCGPGTKLEKRMERGDKGINGLDAACKTHDIAYSQSSDIKQRHKADQQLAERAWERVKSKDSTWGEKLNSYLVSNIMKAKVKMGMGVSRKVVKGKCGKQLFTTAVKKAVTILKKEKPQDIETAIKIAKNVIDKTFKRKKSQVVIPRVIRVPKIGGFLPIVPILTALSAMGAIASGGASIAKALNTAKNAKEQLQENIRHNNKMESIAMGKGLYLKPFKNGMGIVYKKNNKQFLKN